MKVNVTHDFAGIVASTALNVATVLLLLSLVEIDEPKLNYIYSVVEFKADVVTFVNFFKLILLMITLARL